MGMRSAMPVAGTLLVMLFVGLGFLHALWAMWLEHVSTVSLLEIVILLFTGETLTGTEELEATDSGNRYWFIVLQVLGIMLFLTCTINVFIAVMGDSYDLEQTK